MKMNLNSQQMDSLKTRVKEKLVEIGEYVDDQLTDYVMIMVTNKKSEKQMAEDLELFLGGFEKASKFSSWLCSEINAQLMLKESSSSKSSNNKKSAHAVETEELDIQLDTSEFNEPDNTNQTQQKSSENLVDQSSNNKTVSKPNTNKLILSCIGAVINRSPSASSSSTDRDREQQQQQQQQHLERRQRHSRSEYHHDDRFYRRSRSRSRDYTNEHDDRSRQRRSSPSRRNHDLKSRISRHADKKPSLPSKDILRKAVDEANCSVKQLANVKCTKSFADLKLEQIRKQRQENEENDRPKVQDETLNSSKREVELVDATCNADSATDKRKVVNNIIDLNCGQSALQTLDPNKTDTQTETKFIITLSGLREEQLFSKMRSYEQSLNQVDEEELDYDETIQEEDMEDKSVEEEGEEEGDFSQHKKKPIRCTFWPMCEKGDLCAYLHPNKPCTTFPNCQFGQLCHYIHPNCKYDGYCTRADCSYTHQAKRSASIIASATSSAPLTISLNSNDEMIAFESGQEEAVDTQITINSIQPYSGPTQQADASHLNVSFPSPANNRKPFNRTSVYSPQTKPAYYPASGFTSVVNKPSQYKLVKMAPLSTSTATPVASTAPTTTINCKYGTMCKNLHCVYVHTSATSLNQNLFKWVKPSALEQQQQQQSVVSNEIAMATE